MKYLILSLLVSQVAWAKVDLDQAPMEWLVVSALSEKVAYEQAHHHHEEDPLVKEIFSVVQYHPETDELVVNQSAKSQSLRTKLIDFLSQQQANKNIDKAYSAWVNESPSPLKMKLYRVKANWKSRGTYYMNHVHTDISQDNSSLKWLKYTPKETFRLIENFLKRRRDKGVVAFCDHDTDRAFDDVASLDKSTLSTLRGIEWGGATHMTLVGIKPNWDLLDRGREFEREVSVMKSRSSEGFRVVNHPFRKSVPMKVENWLDANGVEVWNTLVEGAPFTMFNIRRSNNRKALAEWARALEQKKFYTAVAGSDFHFAIPCLRDRTLVYPVNIVDTDNPTQVKQLLMQGRSAIATRPSAPKLRMELKTGSNTYYMGQNVKGSGSARVSLIADFSDTQTRLGGACYNVVNTFYKLFTFWKKRKWEVRFYNKAGQVIAKSLIKPGSYGARAHLQADLDIKMDGTDLVRAEIWEINSKMKSVDLVAATNPILINW